LSFLPIPSTKSPSLFLNLVWTPGVCLLFPPPPSPLLFSAPPPETSFFLRSFLFAPPRPFDIPGFNIVREARSSVPALAVLFSVRQLALSLTPSCRLCAAFFSQAQCLSRVPRFPVCFFPDLHNPRFEIPSDMTSPASPYSWAFAACYAAAPFSLPFPPHQLKLA